MVTSACEVPRAPRGRDPFDDLGAELVVEHLVARGWAREVFARAGGSPVIAVGAGVVAVVTVGRDGAEALDRVCGAHGALPVTPALTAWSGDGEVRTVRFFRAPPGLAFVNAENLHGQVGGVSVLVSARFPLPPRRGDGGTWARWVAAAHPSTRGLAELPAWLADAARDPGAAARLSTTVRATDGGARELAAWESTLVRAGRRTANTFGNVMKIFRRAPCYAGRFRLNLMTQGVEFDGRAIPEGRIGSFREQVEDAPWGGFSPSEAAVMQAIRTLAEDHAHHPVQSYLNGLAWDGVARLDAVATELLHADPDPLVSLMVQRWFISAVARALSPGCQVDTALVLMGAQGRRKSSFFRALAGDWFADTEIRIGDKDSYGQIHAAWLTELGELDRVTSLRHAGEVKAFVSRRADTFRPPYARTTATFPRSCVLVGSTNENEFLNDPTGSRRFWVVRVRATIDAELVAAWRDQLWAEAVHRHRQGEIHYLLPAEDEARERAADEYRVRDAWEEVVETWVTERWPMVSIETQQKLLTTQTILRKALGLEPRDMDRGVAMRLGRVMTALGFVNKRERVPRAAADLYRDSEGRALKLVHAWVPAGAPERAGPDDAVEPGGD